MFRLRFLSLVIFVIALCSCQTNKKPIPKPSMYGIWKMEGYGRIVEIKKKIINFYDITKESCLLVKSTGNADIGEPGEIIKLGTDSLFIKKGITNYKMVRIHELPISLIKKGSMQAKNPIYNFDVFWNTFKENYAFFEERRIDWNKVYQIYRPKISDKTTDVELYLLIKEILDKFKDDHISFNVPDVVTKNIRNVAKADVQSNNDTFPEIGFKKLRETILHQYLKNYKTSGRDMHGKGLINWGITKGNVGYLQVNWMLFYRDYKISDALKDDKFLSLYFERSSTNPNHIEQEVQEVKKVMDEVIKSFKHVKGVIIDLRFNGGGYDAAALEILSHFTDQKTFAFSKKAKLEEGFTERQNIYIVPSKTKFIGKVCLLTSHQTASAAEIFTISSMALNNFVRIGSNTEGIFSDVLEKKLPNGWGFTLSNELYQNHQGKNFENIGVDPNLNIAYEKDQNLFYRSIISKIGKGDPAIDTALSVLK